MTLSPVAQSLLDAAVALARDDGPRFVAALKAHDWKAAAKQAVLAELELAAAAGVRGAAIALHLARFAEILSLHPADPAAPAMAKASGGDAGQNISTGA
ncbi:MAG: hypothetical protein KDJ20_08320 [Hyphomicrobiales bacterium]|nr:hypothetical protein [Rhodoblastus sp.]MCC2099919.1 hypothetical protein [Hyphomicrobiales bacterium]MCO5088891.1 hypothetical protein [Methylobacteriaceae bacterium]MCB1525439.1 hypothetical protein [Rhodoblastus sp.]MCC2104031.1 hypothetical protein [Hyphomicrobiales bacterium]